jgi:S-layer family protein
VRSGSIPCVFAGLAAVALSAAPAGAQVKAGPEFRANSFTTSYQARPQLSVQPNGDFVVVWQSYGQEGGGDYGVFGQRFARDGSPRGTEFQANTFTADSQARPKVAVNRAGKFVVVWQSAAQNGLLGIFGQRYDATGARVGAEFQANTDTAGYQYGPAVAINGQGGFVVVWTSTAGDGPGEYGIRGQRFDPNGARLGAEFSVNTYSVGYQEQPNIAGTPDGRFVVVWESDAQDGNAYGAFGQRFDATGAKAGAEFQANTYTTGSQQDPTVGMTPDGRFVVGWESNQGDLEVRSQRYDAAGNRVGAEFAVNSYTTGSQFLYGIALDAQGNYAMVWDDLGRDGDDYGDFGWRVSSTDTRRGVEFQANTYTTGYQGLGIAAGDEVGNFVVLWHSDAQDGSELGVFGQRFGGLFPTALRVNTTGNLVWEPGETADLRPTWRNTAGSPQTFSGTLSGLTGPAGATYTIGDNAASYGTVPNNTDAPCTDCYSITVSNPATRPVLHWDATVLESISPDAQGQQKSWTLHIGGSFADVPTSNAFYRFIETMLHFGVTGGCGGNNFCPGNTTARDQMAVFMLVALEGPGYAPPACTTPVFNDVPASNPFCRFVEELVRRGVVGGCGGGNYCPTAGVTREQMPVFVLRTFRPTVDPPPCVPGQEIFNDVPASSPFCRWIEELFRGGVAAGCGNGNYCPLSPVTREQMAVFVSASLGLTLYGP